MILLSKGKGTISDSHSQAVLNEVIENDISSTSRNERQIYTDYIGQCLKRGIAVEFDAKTAYDYIARKLEAVK